MAIISLVGTLLGIILTIFFFIKGRRIRRVVYFQKSINIIQSKLPEIDNLELTIKNKNIENFTLTNIVMWNDGTETINIDDVAPHNKLRIATKNNSRILSYKLVYGENKSNNFRFNLNNAHNVLSIGFDYFDRNQGFILRIFHTGQTDEDLGIEGDIKGTLFRKREVNLKDFVKENPGSYRLFLIITHLLPSIFYGGVWFSWLFFDLSTRPDWEGLRKYALVVLPAVLIFINLGFFKMYKNTAPRGFGKPEFFLGFTDKDDNW